MRCSVKYRGKVIDNEDPLLLCRMRVDLAVSPGALLTWCMPCMPYTSPATRLSAIPPRGANVWIEFEGGDVNFPIWSGCFWSEDEALTASADGPG